MTNDSEARPDLLEKNQVFLKAPAFFFFFFIITSKLF